MTKTTAALIAATFFAGSMATATAAPLIASDYLGNGTEGNFDRATGWGFTPSESIFVTWLGVYDLGTEGLADRHEVGIFDSTGSEIVSVFVGSGTSADFAAGTVAGTRFVNVTSTQLLAGTSYYIVATNFSTDTFAYGTGSVTYASPLSWNGFVDCGANDIRSTCTNLGGSPGNLGPNFGFEASVPEPATLALMGLGFAGLVATRRRRVV